MAALIAAVAVRLRRIRVWLFPNYLPKIKGKYIPRTANAAMLTIEDVCVEKSGGKLDYEAIVTSVKHFLDEGMHQMCDDFGLNLFYCSLHPGVTGTVDMKHLESYRLCAETYAYRVCGGNLLQRR
jgi:hypothetical protein